MFLKNSNIHIFVNDNTNICLINILSFANFNYIIYNEHRRSKRNWGLGIGDWGLGIGDWGLGPIPNPHSNDSSILDR